MPSESNMIGIAKTTTTTSVVIRTSSTCLLSTYVTNLLLSMTVFYGCEYYQDFYNITGKHHYGKYIVTTLALLQQHWEQHRLASVAVNQYASNIASWVVCTFFRRSSWNNHPKLQRINHPKCKCNYNKRQNYPTRQRIYHKGDENRFKLWLLATLTIA